MCCLLNEEGAAAAETGGTVTNYNRIRGTGLTYQFSAVRGTAATFETVPAGGNYIVFNGIQSDFQATITPSAPALSATVLGTGSQGATGNGEIGSLTAGAKYAVQWRGGWYPLTATGLGAKGSLVEAAQTAIAGAAPGTTATGFINDEVYNVFAVGALTHQQKINTNLPGSGAKNAIADVSALSTSSQEFGHIPGAGATSPAARHIYIVDNPILTGIETATLSTQAVLCTGIKYTATMGQSDEAAAATTTIQANAGDRYFTVVKGDNATSCTWATSSN